MTSMIIGMDLPPGEKFQEGTCSCGWARQAVGLVVGDPEGGATEQFLSGHQSSRTIASRVSWRNATAMPPPGHDLEALSRGLSRAKP